MKKSSRTLTMLLVLLALFMAAVPLASASEVIPREIVEYEYTLEQTSTSSALRYTEAAERKSNYGRLSPAINRVNSTNASHNIYFKIVSATGNSTMTNVYWHRSGRDQYEWIVDIAPGETCKLGMRRNTSDSNSKVDVKGSWSPDQNDIIIPRR